MISPGRMQIQIQQAREALTLIADQACAWPTGGDRRRLEWVRDVAQGALNRMKFIEEGSHERPATGN